MLSEGSGGCVRGLWLTSDLQFPESPDVNPAVPVLGPLCPSLVLRFLLDILLPDLLALELSTGNDDLANVPPNGVCSLPRKTESLALSFR